MMMSQNNGQCQEPEPSNCFPPDTAQDARTQGDQRDSETRSSVDLKDFDTSLEKSESDLPFIDSTTEVENHANDHSVALTLISPSATSAIEKIGELAAMAFAIDNESNSAPFQKNIMDCLEDKNQEFQEENIHDGCLSNENYDSSFPQRQSPAKQTYSCHLQEVEMILERITSAATACVIAKVEGAQKLTSSPSIKSSNRKSHASARWRDYLCNVGGALGFTDRNGENRVNHLTSTMSTRRNEKLAVSRSQSMRQHGHQRSCAKTTFFPQESASNDDSCLGRRGGMLVSQVTPSLTWKSSNSRNMDTNSDEVHSRTTNSFNRHNRRCQSMRVPSARNQVAPENQIIATEANSDFERMRMFTIDPTKPGIVINRGDSFRRRSQTEISIDGKPYFENGLLSQHLPLSSTSSLGIDRRSRSPMIPTNHEMPSNKNEAFPFSCVQQADAEVRKYDIMVVGLDGVGKTSMVNQFMTSEYCNPFQSDAVESVALANTVNVQLDGVESRLSFHEFDNQKDDRWMNLNGDGYVIVYSIDDALSFRNAKKLARELRQRVASAEKPIILVANKIDLERKRQVTADDGRSLARENDCKFVEIAVALGHHLDELLVGILAQLRQIESDRSTACSDPTQNVDDPNVETQRQQIFDSLLSRRASRSVSNNDLALGCGQSYVQQQNQTNFRRSSTKRRKRSTASKTSDSSCSPTTSCTNLTAVGQRFRKMFGRRHNSRSLEDLLSIA